MTTYFITGGGGFIGSSFAEFLLKKGHSVTSFDNFNDFYDPKIKQQNIKRLSQYGGFESINGDIRDADTLNKALNRGYDIVIHLAAMAGVRPSIEDPKLYYDVNINGTFNLLDGCSRNKPKKIVLASSSSVYGNNKKVPFEEKFHNNMLECCFAHTKKVCLEVTMENTCLFPQLNQSNLFTEKLHELLSKEFIQRTKTPSSKINYPKNWSSRSRTCIF